jgi:hypothetical protein
VFAHVTTTFSVVRRCGSSSRQQAPDGRVIVFYLVKISTLSSPKVLNRGPDWQRYERSADMSALKAELRAVMSDGTSAVALVDGASDYHLCSLSKVILSQGAYMRTNDSVAEMLELEHVGPGQFVGKNLPGPSPVVFGGQILAQSVAAAALSVPDKQIKSLHTVFARGGSPDAPLEIDVDVLQQGRTFASLSLTTHQGARMCTRSVALLHEPEPDLIRHSDDAPRASGPDQTPSRSGGHPWWELRVVDDLDLQDPDQVGPP